MILSAWNPVDLDKMALPPCHVLSQYYVDVEQGTISCQLYQRSGDMFLGVPYNIASYSFLTYIFAHLTGYKPGKLVHIIGDAHIYEEHIEAIHKQLSRNPKMKPTLQISSELTDINDIQVEHFTLEEYDSHEVIRAPMIA
jgi:thymidylate synthase